MRQVVNHAVWQELMHQQLVNLRRALLTCCCSLQVKDPRHCTLIRGQADSEAEGLRSQG